MSEHQAVRPFAAVLQEHRKGASMQELSEALADVVRAVGETGKPGSVTLKVTVRPMKGDLAVTFTDEIVVKVPRGERGASIFFADDDGNLTRTNPNQLSFPPVQAVPDAPGRDTDAQEVAT